MNYPQFFAFLSNQCSRFATDAEVPEAMERVLTELNRATAAADVDPPLVEPFRALLGPVYRDVLSQAFMAVQKATNERIAQLDAARAELHAQREETIKAAQKREQEAIKQVETDRQQIADLSHKVNLLEQRLAALKP